VWGDTLPVLRAADMVVANLECPITESNERWPHWKTWRFRAHPRTVEILREANVRFVNLANNHILDYQARGLFDTIEHLDAAGIGHAGAGADADAAAAGRLVDLGGLKLGFLALTNSKRAFAAGPAQPGSHFVPIRAEDRIIGPIADRIAGLRRAGASTVVVTAHWGPNMRLAPRPEYRRFAHALIEAGVDVLHGHSAHVVQAVEQHGPGLVLYDTGNFIDDYWKFPLRQTRWTFVFLVELAGGRVRRLRLVPVEIGRLAVRLARGRSQGAIIRYMAKRSASIGTGLEENAHGLELMLDRVSSRTPLPGGQPAAAFTLRNRASSATR
jgi:poly-gamma-glutamate synthesis protein (capsule biosynthesis protein)